MIVNAPTVEKFEPLKKIEVDAMITQINGAFEQGVPPEEVVQFPTFVLAQLLRTVQVLESQLPKIDSDAFENLLNSVPEEVDAEVTQG